METRSIRSPVAGRDLLLTLVRDVGSAQATKSSHVCPSVGNNINVNISCGNNARLIHHGGGDEKC
jgi:hypothetical protein